MRGFKYYVSLSESGRGWEVLDDEANIMGIYATQAEAHAAITEFVHNDVDELMGKLHGRQGEDAG